MCYTDCLFIIKNVHKCSFVPRNVKNVLYLCKHSHPRICAPKKITLLIDFYNFWGYTRVLCAHWPVNNCFTVISVNVRYQCVSVPIFEYFFL